MDQTKLQMQNAIHEGIACVSARAAFAFQAVDRVGIEPLSFLAREECNQYISQPIAEVPHASPQRVDIFGVRYVDNAGLEPALRVCHTRVLPLTLIAQ